MKASEPRLGDWMAAAQRGDEAAYRQLLEALLPALRAYVGRIVGDATPVEDVVQNALLQLHRARHTYRPERSFGPWVRAIARNASLDALRKSARRSRRETPLGEEESGFARHAAAPDATGDVARALATLPDGQREAFTLLHVDELTLAEAALRLGTTPGAVKARVHRAVVALRAWLRAAAP